MRAALHSPSSTSILILLYLLPCSHRPRLSYPHFSLHSGSLDPLHLVTGSQPGDCGALLSFREWVWNGLYRQKDLNLTYFYFSS